MKANKTTEKSETAGESRTTVKSEKTVKNNWEVGKILKIVGLCAVVAALIILIIAAGYGIRTIANLGNQPIREAQAVATTTTVETKSIEVEKATVETTVKEEAATIETSIVEEKAVETTKEATEEDVIVAEGTVPKPYEKEGGLPTSGTTWTFDVFPEEIEVLTGGPGMINGVKLPGGDNPDRGFVIIMLPSTDTIRYEVTELWPGSNWHAAYKYGRIPIEADWRALLDQRSFAMFDPNEGNGAHGKGVLILDQVVVQGNEVIFQRTVER